MIHLRARPNTAYLLRPLGIAPCVSLPQLIAISRFYRAAYVGTTAAIFSLSAYAEGEVSEYRCGFDEDLTGWHLDAGSPVRMPDGSAGLRSSDGDGWFARIAAAKSPHTDWGGFRRDFPVGGYSTSVDIFLSLDAGVGSGTRFDFSSAINDRQGGLLREFVFNVAYFEDEEDGANKRFVISAGSRSNPAINPSAGPAPATLTKSGWYRFVHRFENLGGKLQVTLALQSVSDPTDLHVWKIADPTDTVGVSGVVGGNRHGAFLINQFPNLAVDRLTYRSGSEPPPR